MTTFSEHIEREIRDIVGDECSFDSANLETYSKDASWYKVTPVGVVHPRSAEEVQALVRSCLKHDLAIIPRGAGTGLAGQAIGYGLVLDFTTHMNKVLEVQDNSVTVQPGLLLGALNAHLAPQKRYFPIDPASGSLCTLGGMIGTNAAGSHGIKYGATKHYVKDLTVVLSDGEIATISDDIASVDEQRTPFLSSCIKTLTPVLDQHKDLIRQKFPDVRKNSSGYNLTDVFRGRKRDFRRLFVGSEGTLGITVQATLETAVVPPFRLGAAIYLPTYEKTADAIVLGMELEPAALEILDNTYVALVKGTSPEIDALILDEARAMLYVEFEGQSKDDLEKQVLQLNRSVSLSMPLKFLPLTKDSDIRAIWKLREEASKVINLVKSKGKSSFIEDVTVPVHQIPSYLRGLANILGPRGIEFSAYGHAGAGNIHCATFVDLHNTDHYRSIDSIASEVYDLAISLGGTLSGEHGDGYIRTPFLERLYGPEVYELFRTVKKTFDPHGIFNPGKIVGPQNESILHDLDLS